MSDDAIAGLMVLTALTVLTVLVAFPRKGGPDPIVIPRYNGSYAEWQREQEVLADLTEALEAEADAAGDVEQEDAPGQELS